VRRGVALVLLSALGCAPSEGAVFVGRHSTSSEGGEDSPGDTSSTGQAADDSTDASTGAGVCGPVGVVQGDDPRFDHACGEDCDTDWCACDPCPMVFGPLGRLPAGAYTLRVLGGASGSGTFGYTLRSEDGALLASETRTYDGLFDDTLDFDIADDCTQVELSIQLESEVCSRIYEVEAFGR
jgi:hypothetical protein